MVPRFHSKPWRQHFPKASKCTRSLSNHGKCASKSDAIVIGGGIAGLLSAHVLSKHLKKVTLIEKDEINAGRVELETFSETARRRRGVPQITQPHQLIAGAVINLETLLPGFRKMAISQGAVDLDLCQHVHYFDYNGTFPRTRSGLQGLGISRRLLEQCIRDRILLENSLKKRVLNIQKGKATDFLCRNGQIYGVVLNDGTELQSHLVVDASGHSSFIPQWLGRNGFEVPQTIVVNPHVNSVSRMVRMPLGFQKDWKALLCKSQPYGQRGGTLLPCEGDLWQVTLASLGGRDMPKDDASFLDFAKSLPDPTMFYALRDSVPITPIKQYTAMRNERVCYHEINMPRGLLAIGDSVQRLNALYGQGIAVSSKSAVLLSKALATALKKSGTEGSSSLRECLISFGQRFQTSLEISTRDAWNFATKSDLMYCTTTANLKQIQPMSHFEESVIHSLLTAAQKDANLYCKLLEVIHLVSPPDILFRCPTFWINLFRGGFTKIP